MRAVWFLLAVSAAWAQPHCAVSGVVTDNSTGKPVAGVKLFLVPHSSAPLPSLLTHTGDQGTFCFEQADAGHYTLRTQRSGYLDNTYGHGLILAVGTGEDVAPLAVKLIRRAVLSGTVVDGDGEPVANADVSVYRRPQSADDIEQEEVDSQETDDRGLFRLANLPPGTYFLGVTVRRDESADLNSRFLDADGRPRQEGYAETFYSGATRFEDAKPITLQAGKNVPGLLFTVLKLQFRHLSGKVAVPARGYITLRHSNGNTKDVPIGADGSFYAGGLESGAYTVELREADEIRGRKEVDLTNGDLDGVVIAADAAPASGFTISLQFRTEGLDPPYQPPMSSFTFLSRIGGDGGSIARPNPDGPLQFSNVTPGLYKLVEYGMAGDFYVKRILLAGQPVPAGQTLDLRHGDPGGIQIVIGRKSAAVTGRITHTGILSEAVTVFLVAESGRTEERAVTDQEGRFQLEPVAPGKYSLFAVEGFDPNRWNSAVAARLREKSLAIELADGEKKTAQPSAITSQEFAAAIK